MFPIKKTQILFFMGFFFASLQPTWAQKKATTVLTAPVVAVVKKAVKKTATSFELGTSYNMWNERLVVSNGSVTTEGFANYAGFGINLEKNWKSARWFRGASLGYSFGKASSGGFDTVPMFADGINRSWQATQATVFSLYRFDTTFSGGVGLLVRQRDADWVAKDVTLSVSPSANTQVAGQLLMRWQVFRRLAFLQSYTFLNFDGSTMWTWAAQFSL